MDRGVDTSYCDYSLAHVDKTKFDPRQSEAFLVQAAARGPMGHPGAAGVGVGAADGSGGLPTSGGDVAHDPMSQLQACARSHHLHACVR